MFNFFAGRDLNSYEMDTGIGLYILALLPPATAGGLYLWKSDYFDLFLHSPKGKILFGLFWFFCLCQWGWLHFIRSNSLVRLRRAQKKSPVRLEKQLSKETWATPAKYVLPLIFCGIPAMIIIVGSPWFIDLIPPVDQWLPPEILARFN